MAKQAPSVIFPGYALLAAGAVAPEAGIFIPSAVLPDLDDAEADADAGSAAKVMYELTRTAEKNFNAVPEETRTTVMTIDRGFPTGLDADSVSIGYTTTYTLSLTGSDVANEV